MLPQHPTRARTPAVFIPQDDTETDITDEDPVARRLRFEVGICQGQGWWSDDVGNPTPLAFSTDDLFEAGPPSRDGGNEDASSWPATPQEMPGRLRRAVSYLQAKKRRFWDVGLSAWYASLRIDHPTDMEKVCREASLRAEHWTNEESGEEVWALIALRDGWYVPDGAIEEAVFLRVTSGRSPWAEPELLPEP